MKSVNRRSLVVAFDTEFTPAFGACGVSRELLLADSGIGPLRDSSVVPGSQASIMEEVAAFWQTYRLLANFEVVQTDAACVVEDHRRVLPAQ